MNRTILRMMLARYSQDCTIQKLEEQKVIFKNIVVGPTGRVQDPVSFSTFRFVELIKTPFENSRIYSEWSNTMVFLIWKREDKGRHGQLFFDGAKIFKMPYDDLSGPCKEVYQDLQEKLIDGKVFKLESGKIKSNLPSALFNSVCHVRPKAQRGTDSEPLPCPDQLTGVAEMTRQCFWLNREYVQRAISQ